VLGDKTVSGVPYMNIYQPLSNVSEKIQKFYKTPRLLNDMTVGLSVTKTGFVKDDIFCVYVHVRL
jgi:hypothetical protein